ncbi:MAG: hypothetical protein HN379_04945, partial [Desulfobacteraceae bacterium]|nr:hypothetical protein [Desulfobacteraceae bacterium]
MKFKYLMYLVVFFVSMAFSQAYASVGKITSVEGDVIIITKDGLNAVTRVGVKLNNGDRIQTKDGKAEVTFNDGAVLKVHPFATSMIQEHKETLGFWIFKTKKSVRRITVFVGKLWFKSGTSSRKNYLQTPTSVCALRGTEDFLGFDNISSYLDLAVGSADIKGNVKQGVFGEIGEAAAKNNNIFKRNAEAQAKLAEAESLPDTTPEQKKAKALAIKEAEVVVVKAAVDSFYTLQQNGNLSEDATAVVTAALAAAEADFKDTVNELEKLT